MKRGVAEFGGTQQHAKNPRRGLKRPLPEVLLSGGTTAPLAQPLPEACSAKTQPPRTATAGTCTAKTTASHGHCRDLNRRDDCLARPLPEGLNSKTQRLRTATAGRLVSDDTRASHDHSRKTCSWPLTALVLEVLQETRPHTATCRRTCSWPLTALVPEVLQRR